MSERGVRSPFLSRWNRLTLLGTIACAVAVTLEQAFQRGYDNNFTIFRVTSDHLRSGADLYAAYPGVFEDLYKYSPTFALLFTPWALLPFPVAHAAWMLTSALALWAAFVWLYDDDRAAVAWVIVAGSLVLDMQRAQLNAPVAALMIGAFAASERGYTWRSVSMIGVATAVKLFPVLAAIGVFWQRRPLRTIAAAAVVAVVLVALPLLVTSPHTLGAQYLSWLATERADAQSGLELCARCVDRTHNGAVLYGGIMYHIRLLFGPVPNLPVQLAGVALLIAPVLLRRDAWQERGFQHRVLAALLLFFVVFNHQAESPTFVLAVCGMAVWFNERGAGRWQLPLLCVAVVIAAYGTGDLFPRAFRNAVMLPYRVRTLPCFMLWLVVEWELLRYRLTPGEGREAGERHPAGRPHVA